jgi:uncharacterized membrane protein
MQTIDTNGCFLFAWEQFKKRPWFFIGFTAFVFVVSIVVTIIRAQLSGLQNDFIDGIGFFAGIVISVYVGFVQTRLYLQAHDSVESINLRKLWEIKEFGNFALLYVVLGMALIFGFFLFIIPGILLSLYSIFAIYIYVDKELSPMDSFKASYALAKDHLWEIFIFMLELLCINILGAILLLVGLLSIPISLLATVHLYRLLQKPISVKEVEPVKSSEIL